MKRRCDILCLLPPHHPSFSTLDVDNYFPQLLSSLSFIAQLAWLLTFFTVLNAVLSHTTLIHSPAASACFFDKVFTSHSLLDQYLISTYDYLFSTSLPIYTYQLSLSTLTYSLLSISYNDVFYNANEHVCAVLPGRSNRAKRHRAS
jgi:hypothetical protein